MNNFPYKTSRDAFIAINEALAHAVRAYLEDCEYDEAIKCAENMREIEKHIFGVSNISELDVMTKQSNPPRYPNGIDYSKSPF